MNIYKSPTHFKNSKKVRSYQLCFEQDAILFGVEWVNSIFQKIYNTDTNQFFIDWHFQDEDVVLKNQSFATYFLDEQSSSLLNQNLTELNFTQKDIGQGIAYLSGTKTLAHCYAENAEKVLIAGSHTRNFTLWDWELKALRTEGILASPYLPEQITRSEKDLQLALQSSWKVIALDINLGFETIKSFLKSIPDSTVVGCCGPILPEDLKQWSLLDIQVIWPELLQGNFPTIQFNSSEQ